jgi:hypothetical protein
LARSSNSSAGKPLAIRHFREYVGALPGSHLSDPVQADASAVSWSSLDTRAYPIRIA